MGEKYLKRYKKYFRDPEIREFVMQHEQWLFGGKQYTGPVLKAINEFMETTVGFSKKSGTGWQYTWHPEDPKNEFHFERNECIYAKILGKRGLMKLGAMCCYADIINYGQLHYTDFIRTKTLCQGGDVCDFRFVRHPTDAEDGCERTKSI